jgi:hypothetical protein
MTFERLWTENYRGQRVPRILGFWLLGCLGLVTLALALAAYLLQRPVKCTLSREESLLVHPKRAG